MTATADGAPAAARHVRAVFVVHGLLFASWTAHIPQIKASLGLGDAGLGLALLGGPVGSVAAVAASAALLARFHSRRLIPVAVVLYALVGVLVGLARSPLGLAVALAAWGATQGLLDVSMNTQGIAAEIALRRPILSGLHAAWSIGAFAGAGAGALAVALGVSLTAQMAVLGPLAGAIALAAPGRWLHDADPAHGRSSARVSDALGSPTVWLLGAIAFAGMLCEGAAADWSAVYLRSAVRASAAVAGLGYAAFAAAMVAVRLSGDRLLSAVAPRTVLPALATVATAGMALALLLPGVGATFVGLACLGVGLGLVVPAAFSAAGRLSEIPTATGVASVSGIGWTGFVGGPPVIGRLAGAVTLPVALGLLPLLTAAIAIAARAGDAFSPATGRRVGA